MEEALYQTNTLWVVLTINTQYKRHRLVAARRQITKLNNLQANLTSRIYRINNFLLIHVQLLRMAQRSDYCKVEAPVLQTACEWVKN